ncbi:tRNA (guanine(9)-N1)-methyltransferase [Penicillium angulare]|uniref:tRNA (guanine(9)-N1)-methyltransferase n=1 Tax=Penicillium angulare TaxID=116970 RepID=UPI002541997C|nr:tRNA (guanine(9)-N1)-methyltransferase [Penicillium angulare]KAJ5289078.1 tRNA (guanine(9)-N1)-methyltransferase [Penicillium angulare]
MDNDNEERPRKLAKRDHDEGEDSAHSELVPAMTGAVSAEPQVAAVSSIEDANKELAEKPNINTDTNTIPGTDGNGPTNIEATDDGEPKMSKNQLKKLRRREQWEQGRDNRREIRKQKMAEKKDRRRQAVAEAREKGGEEAVKALLKSWEKTKHEDSQLLPMSIVIDCGYDELMHYKERISLASQMTRSYSDNSRARFRTNLMFSSFDKLLKERFDTVLVAHKNWKGVKIIQEDFVHAAEIAKETMASPRGGKLVGHFAEMDRKPEDGEVIYLSSDSENTLTELKPYDTYIIGGLVDKNRHKAICYKSALEKGVKTAKLPIGDYIQMASRQVLTTNHVVEIMLKWLELRDWGEAFLKVLPQRKGGKLLAKSLEAGDGGEVEDDDDDEENEEDQIAAVEAALDAEPAAENL